MRAATAFFVSEYKRFFRKRNIILFALLWVSAMVFVQMGTYDYKYRVNQREVFQKNEKEKVSKCINYTQYGYYGFQILFIPHPICILSTNSGVIQEMTSFVDSSERLNIYESLKGKNIFTQKIFPYTDFSGIILFFGALLILLYGFDTFTNRDYLMTQVSMSNSRQIFFPLVASRIAMILLLIMAIIAGAMLIILANGLRPPINIDLFWFLLLLFLVFIFFFIIGTLFSTSKSRVAGISILFTTWFVLLFAIPAALNNFIASKATSTIIAVEQLEKAKLDILSNFEKKAIENKTTYRYGETLTQPVKDAVLSYWNNEFKQIQSLEDNMISEMEKIISLHQTLSIFFPTTNYFSVSNELSSMGYLNYADFYQYIQKLKREFVKFYIDKLYFTDLTKFPEVESFIKSDENTFKGTSRLPAPFAWGLLVLLLQITGLTCWSYYRFKKTLYQPAKEELNQKLEKEMAFEKGQFDVYFEDNSLYTRIHYSAFSGHGGELVKNGFTGKITVDDRDIISQGPGKENSLVFICNPNEFPADINAGDFINFYTRFLGVPSAAKKAIQYQYLTPQDLSKPIGKLQSHQKGELLFKILDMKKGGIYLLGDVCKKMPYEFVCQFKKKMEALAAEGSLVLFTNTELDFHTYRSINSPLLFLKSKHWKAQVDNLEAKLSER